MDKIGIESARLGCVSGERRNGAGPRKRRRRKKYEGGSEWTGQLRGGGGCVWIGSSARLATLLVLQKRRTQLASKRERGEAVSARALALWCILSMLFPRALSLSLGGYLFFIGCPGNRIPSDINHLYRGFLICVHFFLLVFHPSRTRLSFSFFSCLYALFDICPAFDARGFLLLPSPPSLALPQSRFTSSSSYLSRFPRRRYIYIHAYV